jgi:ABC-type molybdate transport system ATPase subunit
MQVTVAVRAEDVIVSKGVPEGISARNIYEVRITALSRTGPDVTLRCASGEIGKTPDWIVRVTPAAVTSLGLGVGQSVFLAVKSHSVRLV